MSVLRNRIMQSPCRVAEYADAQGVTPGPEYTHPFGTRATPMVMPLALVDYGGAGTAQYQDLHAMQPATGDVNAVPFAVVAPGSFGKVVASGRP